jgi:hypothetical protein
MAECAVSTLFICSSPICTKKCTCLLTVSAIVHAGQIYCVCQIHEERWEHIAVHQLFVDLIIAGVFGRGGFV